MDKQIIGCSGGNHTRFAIFALKGMGWTDDPIKQKQIENPFEGLTIEQLERLAEFGE